MLSNRIYRYGTESPLVRKEFIGLHYSHGYAEYNEDVLLVSNATIPSAACAAYVAAWTSRKDITALVQEKCPGVELLLFCGDANPDYVNHTIKLNAAAIPGKSQWIKQGDCGNAIFEEAPHLLSKPIMFWLAGNGYLLSDLESLNEEV
jgi:hypothetical protein